MSPGELLARMGEPLDAARYDWSAAGRTPLAAEETFQLVYAAQVEWATEGTFESLNITRDPLVTCFLDVWLAQERVHAELLARFLEGCGVQVPALHRLPRHRRAARRGRLVNQLARVVVGDDFFAVHMAWGAVNELTTLRFYQQIRRRSVHPLLREVLRDVIAQESMHYSFYRASAVERLAGRPRAQRLTSWALRHLWSPVGVGLRTRQDAHRLARELFDDPQLAQIDRAIARLPGLSGLRLFQHELDHAA